MVDCCTVQCLKMNNMCLASMLDILFWAQEALGCIMHRLGLVYCEFSLMFIHMGFTQPYTYISNHIKQKNTGNYVIQPRKKKSLSNPHKNTHNPGINTVPLFTRYLPLKGHSTEQVPTFRPSHRQRRYRTSFCPFLTPLSCFT